MPLIQIKVFEDALNRAQSKALINKITNAVTEITSEKLCDVTWVINELPRAKSAGYQNSDSLWLRYW